MNAAEVLQASLDYMENGTRWIKYYGLDEVGNVCAVGAPRQVLARGGYLSFFDPEYDVTLEGAVINALDSVITEQYSERLTAWGSRVGGSLTSFAPYKLQGFRGVDLPLERVATFNNHPDTVWEDIERVYEKAIRLEEEKVL